MLYAIRRWQQFSGRERLVVRAFSSSNEMHKFLNTGPNAVFWSQVHVGEPTKTGVYVYAGQQWLNVHNVDASALAHM